jgi:hypothetical protein
MMEYENNSDDEDEVAPDLSVIKKNIMNDKFLNETEIDIAFAKEPIKKSTSRISARRSANKELEKSSIKIKRNNSMEKINNVRSETLKCVNTKSSVNTKSNDMKEYYANLKNHVINERNSDSEDDDDNNSDSDNNYDNNDSFVDEKILNTKSRLDDCEKEKLKSIIKLYLETHEKALAIGIIVKDLRDEKKQYENHILEFMGEFNKEKVTHDTGVLHRLVKQSRPKPNEENILETLKDVFKDNDVAFEITKKIFDSVPMEEKISLKQKEEDEKKKRNKKQK